MNALRFVFCNSVLYTLNLCLRGGPLVHFVSAVLQIVPLGVFWKLFGIADLFIRNSVISGGFC